jgi:HAD superfamily hydrolase (TIGR01509 family)
MASTPFPPSTALPGPWRAVVFDMDGLLVHTERQWLQAKQELFRRYDRELTADDRAAVFGRSDRQSAEYFASRFELSDAHVDELRVEYLEIVGSLMDAGVELTDGATELVGRLRGQVPIALASNTRRPLVDRVLRQTPFGDWFDAIATGDEVPPKPAPDVYRLACERIGADIATTVAVEDSPTGIQAAKAAGLTTIGVPSDAAHPLAEADYQVSSLAELL